VTDLAAADVTAGGPAVVASPDARFESSPTPLKLALLAAHAVLVVGCLLLLVRAGRTSAPARGGRRERVRRPLGHRLVGAAADVAVLPRLLGWAVAGPLQTDDFYYSLEARSIGATGYVGNVVRYFNVPEIPFTLQQHVLALAAAISPAPVVLRLPAVLALAGAWFLLIRCVLPRLVAAAPWWLRPLAAVALLAWVLPFSVGARPEALVVLATTATFALVLEAVARRRPWLLGVAAVVAGAAVSITASGLLAAALLVVLAPRWWPLVRGCRAGPLASASLLVACASAAAPAVFADATLAGALTALRVHDEVGPNLEWWQEPQRYWYLTQGPDPNQRLYSRQLVVLVTLVLLVGTSVALLRSRRRTPTARTSWVVPAAVALAGYAVLAISPTKWSHHFGALAGVGTVAVVVGCAALVRRRPSRWASLGLAAAVAAVAGLALHGPDAQVEHSAYGTVPQLPSWLGQPLLWLGLGALAAVAAWLLRRRRSGAPEAAASEATRRDTWPELVVLTTSVVLVASLALQLLSVARATYVLRGTWSMASSSLAALGGGSCGFADSAVALTGAQALPAAGPA
ncbi:arabinosyltransferase domain-containing protein, partial [Kineococcus glutinatus]|uniref:arabinosyltransferase domain-containing protein n=1 Tax=Kineococcus glutinatus TaxID=1070872 RepID=UPI0031E9E571